MSTSLQPSNLFASIDMGTNSFKLLIIHFDPSSARFTTVHHHSSAVVLGRSSSPPPYISSESRSRAIEAIVEFRSILRSHECRTRVVGTSAIREAINREEFIIEVRKKLGFGFDVEIISGFDEARLTYLGVLQFLNVCDKKVLTLDIGGGSSEILIGENGRVLYVKSLKLGHVTLTQKFRGSDLVELMRGYVYEQILASGLVEKVKDLGFEVAIGSSGTIRAIEKAIWSGFGREEECKKREHWWFSKEELRVLVERLCRGMGSVEDGFFGRRSEFILAGAVLLDVIMELLEVSEMRVSGYALGEGVLAEMVSESFPGCDLNVNMRWRSVMRLAMRFNGKDRMRSGVQCAATAKEIFNGLKEYNGVAENHGTTVGLQEKDLEYLQAACVLHNIGRFYGKEGYHKRSCSIIMEHGQLDGYTAEEIELIARLARYHRKKFPSFECPSLQGFSGEKFGILCSILRISVIIQKNKILSCKDIKFFHAHEGFILALAEKEDRQQHPDLQKTVAEDVGRKIATEVKLFETVYKKKILVAAREKPVTSRVF